MKHVYLLIISVLIMNFSTAQTPINSSNGNNPVQNSKPKSKAVQVPQPTNQLENQLERGKGMGNNSCKSHELTKNYYESIGAWDAFNEEYQYSTAHSKVPPSAKLLGSITYQ